MKTGPLSFICFLLKIDNQYKLKYSKQGVDLRDYFH